ncbi:hypothetical protein HanRHA438_Chr14g0645791 [Helianthus annuus]|nr:hypothetical protein HanHA89_Chr14g0564331 [Helianthus annuus]KAJ0655645.1 hypothetical protein HanLR1_Chr14g0526661 [Helianthus annuus]KAJ0852968.1 hypothetical protein HanRHA438_Chr14g0645791 [Helianthus annuus]
MICRSSMDREGGGRLFPTRPKFTPILFDMALEQARRYKKDKDMIAILVTVCLSIS